MHGVTKDSDYSWAVLAARNLGSKGVSQHEASERQTRCIWVGEPSWFETEAHLRSCVAREAKVTESS